MSAIWGAIDLRGREIPEKYGELFHQSYEKCKIDRWDILREGPVLLGCELQCFTPQSKQEKLPCRLDGGFYFTADVYLDNREDLLRDVIFSQERTAGVWDRAAGEKTGGAEAESRRADALAEGTEAESRSADALAEGTYGKDGYEDLPDGEIFARYFAKYGKERLADLHGSYAFAGYDGGRGVAFVGTDHMANRCLYYAVIDDVLFFSTLIEPIETICRGKLHENRQFLLDFLANTDRGIYQDYDVDATIYEEIKYVPAAQILEFPLLERKVDRDANVRTDAKQRGREERGAGGFDAGDCRAKMQRYEFWRPLEHLKISKGKSDEEYRAELKEIYGRAVKQAIRADGEIGICLSGGLDSTSVACMAAPLLKKKGKQLYAYTMIPAEGYQDDTGKGLIANEQSVVQATARFLGNLAEHYESQNEVNCWDMMPEQLRFLEGPYKSLLNVVLLRGLARKAYAEGCRILLDGQLGNDSISYGNRDANLYEMFITGHFVKFWKEIGTHSAYFRYNKKRVLKNVVKTVFERPQIPDYHEFLDKTLVREYSEKQFRRIARTRVAKTRRAYLFYVLDKARFRQIGEGDTRISLYEGVLCKDPTRNIDFMEWCMRLPSEQFDKNCTSRRLVYEYLSDIITPEILNQRLPRGRQSADDYYRIRGKGVEIARAMEEAFLRKNPVVNDAKALALLQENKTIFDREKPTDEDKSVMDQLLYTYEICLLYEKKF